MLYWVKQGLIVRYYMRDFRHVLKPVLRTARGTSGKIRRQYFIREENIRKLVRMYENLEIEEYVRPSEVFTALQIYEAGTFYWVKSYKSVLRYLKMKEYEHILHPVRLFAKNQELCAKKIDIEKFVSLYKEKKLPGIRYGRRFRRKDVKPLQ